MRNFALIAIPSLLLLGACDSGPPEKTPSVKTETPIAQKKETAAPPKAVDPTSLPPSIVASRQYRCADRSLLFVDYLSDEKSVLVRMDAKGFPVRLSGEKNGVMSGKDYTLKGTKADKFIMFSSPSNPSPQRCQA